MLKYAGEDVEANHACQSCVTVVTNSTEVLTPVAKTMRQYLLACVIVTLEMHGEAAAVA